MKPLNILIMFFTGVIFCSCQSQKLSLQDKSSKELLQISLNHRATIFIFAYDLPCGTGIGAFREECPEFRELSGRNDFAAVLLDEYIKLDPLAVDPDWSDLQIGEFKWKITLIEFLLAQPNIMEQLGEYELRSLKEIAVLNYQKKKMLSEVYGWGLTSPAAVCASIIMKVNPALLEERRSETSPLICNLGADSRFLDEVVELLKSIEI